MKEIVGRIPVSLRKTVADKLVEILLETKNERAVPASLAKAILYFWQRDQLASEAGLERLLEAAMLAEPEQTASFFTEIGLPELAAPLKDICRGG